MRSAGILLPVTALPGGYGVGTLGAAARQFLDFLQAGGQRVWQLLPPRPHRLWGLPLSVLLLLRREPLPDRPGRPSAATACWSEKNPPPSTGAATRARRRLRSALPPALRRPGARRPPRPGTLPREYAAYCKAQAAWLPDYALFMALKGTRAALRGTAGQPLRRRAPDALRRARGLLAPQIAFWQGVQFLFARQWSALRREAAGFAAQGGPLAGKEELHPLPEGDLRGQ